MGDLTIGDDVNIAASNAIPLEITPIETISTTDMTVVVEAGNNPTISATEPDWSRENCDKWWEPSRQLLKCIRGYQKWQSNCGILGKCLRAWYIIWHRFWSVVTGADIPLNCQLAGGLVLPHPNGIVIHPATSIGPNCMIFQQVTIVGGVEVSGHVDIGAGAKIIRPVKIGEHATVGANAVVVHDVPAKATVAGVPAKIIK